MSVLDNNVVVLLNEKTSIKVIGSVGKEGIPHTAVKQSLHIDDEGNIRFFELLEHSQTNRNLTYSLWFNKPISINVIGENHESYEILGRPIRALITGKEFEEAYLAVRKQLGEDTELSTIWVIQPEQVRNLDYFTQLKEHTAKHPFVLHLDRLQAEK